MCLTASSPEWISRPIEGSAWLASKRRVFGLTNSNDGFRLLCTGFAYEQWSIPAGLKARIPL